MMTIAVLTIAWIAIAMISLIAIYDYRAIQK